MSAVGTPILRLSNELLLLIVEELDLDAHTRGNVLEVALVSRRFHDLASCVLLRSLEIHFSPRRYESNMRLFARLQGNDVRNKVHFISVNDLHRLLTEYYVKILDNTILDDTRNRTAFHDSYEYHAQFRAFIAVIPKLNQLENIRCNTEFPVTSAILEAVHSYLPNCTIEVREPVYGGISPAELDMLKRSRNLSSLWLLIGGPEDSEATKVISFFPKLKTLAWRNLRFPPGSSGPPRLGKRDRDVLQNVEKLKLWNYQVRSEEEEEWKQLFNWSRLKVLNVTSCQLISLIPTELSELKAFSIEPLFAEKITAVEEVANKLRGCRALEKLSSKLTGLVNPSLLAHVGKSLTTLRLDNINSLVTVSQIHDIARFCHQLRMFRLVIDFTDTWVREDGWVPEILAAIADHLLTIEELEIKEIGHRINSERVKRRFLRLSDIWSYLWTRREAKRKENLGPTAPRFQLLTVDGIGNLPLTFDEMAWPFYQPFALVAPIDLQYFKTWISRNTYEVRLSSRDDEIGSGTAYLVNKLLQEARRTGVEHNVDLDKTEFGRWIEKTSFRKVVPGDDVVVEDGPKFRQRTLLEFDFIRT